MTSFDTDIQCLFTAALTKEILDKYRSTFYQDSKNILAQNVCSRIDPFDVCLVRKQVEQPLHIFQHKVKSLKN